MCCKYGWLNSEHICTFEFLILRKSKKYMPRYKLTIEYNGTNFSGWQIQPEKKTVEGTIEQALTRILRTKIDVVGQGRTDAGVHALGQTAHVDLPQEVDIHRLLHALNQLLGDAILIHHMELVSPDFHARFDAIAREYEYRVLGYNAPLLNRQAWWPGFTPDLEDLCAVAPLFLGKHDFAGFSKKNPDNYTTLCEVYISEWKQEGPILVYRIRANRFLRNMVRRIVGTMVEAARGKRSTAQVQQMLEQPDKKVPTYTAPAKGLILKEVVYPL